jgi:hypothetical protein
MTLPGMERGTNPAGGLAASPEGPARASPAPIIAAPAARDPRKARRDGTARGGGERRELAMVYLVTLRNGASR